MVTTPSRPDPRPAVTLPVGRDKHAHYSYRDFFRFNRDQGTALASGEWAGFALLAGVRKANRKAQTNR